ncbi:hypothetical protein YASMINEVIRUS_230 [Yasminevirus sp. GU-2018]|uniref:ASCH domain-containing protein n=1 Tax=Yasminevirus sp. GU-2018 TaxID=2420051 RepID=A0A5K0U7L4_9VIRU|nr:hypothetical protein YASMINEVIRUS_230 [Yasminevirus sp. GU-2018]
MSMTATAKTDEYEQYVVGSVSESESDQNKGDQKTHILNFKDLEGCPFYEQILSGKKTVEGRKNSPVYQAIKAGDTLLLSDRTRGILECVVTYVNLYSDVSEYIASEGIDVVFGDPVKCRNVSDVKSGAEVYREFVDDDQVQQLKEKYGHGFLGIGIKFVHEYKRHFETLNEPWFSAIRDGSKIAEGRLDKSWVSTLKKFDFIEFTRVRPKEESGSSADQKIEVLVTDVKRYKKFTDLFDEVGLDKVLPGKKTYDEGLAVYRQWYSAEKEESLGVVGIFVKVIKK